MNITMINSYEKEKESIFQEALLDKKKNNNMKSILLKNPEGIVAVWTISMMFFILMISIFYPPLFKDDEYLILCRTLSFVLLFLMVAHQIYCYKSEKKYYTNLIGKQESMSLDEYIEYVKNSNKICFDDEYAIEEYKKLNDFYSLLSDDINIIDHIQSEDKNKTFFYVERSNGNKDIISFEDVYIKPCDSDEDKLIYDSGEITLYKSKNQT